MTRKMTAVLLLLLLTAVLLTSCGSRELSSVETELVGRWAYNHEPETEMLKLKKNGRAEYGGKTYDFAADGSFLELTSGKESDSLKLRYELTDEGMILYEKTEYECQGTPDGLTGLWKCEAKNWSFEFTEDGTFLEDGVFTGQVSVNGEEGTFTLQYADFEDTTCYYTLDGDILTVEYPWSLVRIK